MKIGPRFILLLLLMALVGCERSPKEGIRYDEVRKAESAFPFDPAKQLALLKSSDPSADARASFEAGDHRLVGVGGMVIDIPCLEPRSDIRALVFIKVISGTGEGMSSELGKMASNYAHSYNEEMLHLLTDNR